MTAVLTPPAPDRIHWETTLFSGAMPPCAGTGTAAVAVAVADQVSVRAAFQDALHGRARLVDVRPRHTRGDGELASDLEPCDVGSVDRFTGPVIVVGHTCAEAEVVAAALVGHGIGPVSVLAGGFAEWCSQGFPVVRTA